MAALRDDTGVFRDMPEDGTIYNSLVMIDRSGEIMEIPDKNHTAIRETMKREYSAAKTRRCLNVSSKMSPRRFVSISTLNRCGFTKRKRI